MQKIQLKLLGIQQASAASSYTLVLEEVKGDRKLFIVIGVLEAQAIAVELEKLKPLRPMTHDLFKLLASSFNLQLKEVIIHKLYEGVFYANLVVSDGKIVREIDSRTSDAIALALRFNCSVFTTDAIMKEAGVSPRMFKKMQLEEELEKKREEMEGKEEEDTPVEEDVEMTIPLESLSVSKLKKMLKDALADEDYIKAAQLRDAIKKMEDES